MWLHFGPAPSRKEKARASLDAAWSRLSEGGTVLMPIGEYPFSARYGWIQDRYGLSWQIVPAEMDRMMRDGSPEQIGRLTRAFLPMKKLELAPLRAAYEGDS